MRTALIRREAALKKAQGLVLTEPDPCSYAQDHIANNAKAKTVFAQHWGLALERGT